MKWGAPSITRYAADAGFIRPALHTATALALVSSGGIDHYDHSVGLAGTGRYVGLWAVDTDRWPEYAPGELTDPWRAAQVAYELTDRHHGFGWSSAYRAGRHRLYVAHAASSSTLDPFRELPSSHNHVPVAQHQLNALGAQLLERTARG